MFACMHTHIYAHTRVKLLRAAHIYANTVCNILFLLLCAVTADVLHVINHCEHKISTSACRLEIRNQSLGILCMTCVCVGRGRWTLLSLYYIGLMQMEGMI